MVYVNEIIRILNESAIYLLLGFAIAGILHVVLRRYTGITNLLATRKPRSVYLAALFGLPMPLCSCSVLPAALALRKAGASKGATVSFLVSVPETDIVSIMLTYALLGPLLAVYRPVAALVTAIGTGLIVNKSDDIVSKRQAAAVAREDDATGDVEACDSCDTHGAAHHDAPAPSMTGQNKKGSWVRTAFRYGFVEMFDDIIFQLIIGIVVAGGLVIFLPKLGIESIAGGSPLTYLVMLIVGIPLYVCAVASTPIAAGMIVGGISPGAAMVFLLAGPATNLASILVLRKQFGRWFLAAYWGGIATFTILFGVLLDQLFGARLNVAELAAHHTHATPFHIAGTIVLLLLILTSLYRKRPTNKTPRALDKQLTS